MADFRVQTSLGSRIQAARKSRGFKSTRELSAAIGDDKLTESVLENIELGRKQTIDVSQLLNIAMALDLPVSYLLAPMGLPTAEMDLPNLSKAFDGMTPIEFDAWLTSHEGARPQPETLGGRNAATELQALRAWATLKSEVARLEVVLALEASNALGAPQIQSAEDRLATARKELNRQASFLASAGWSVD